MMIVDDLHWADPSSLAFLGFLARDLRDARVLAVGTYRDADLETDHPLVRLPHSVHRLSLRGLSREETGALITATTGRDPGPTVAETTHRRTGGNPFYIREIARLLDGSGEEIPATVREAVRARLAKLSGATVQVLSAASVAGLEFEAGVIAHLIGAEPAGVRSLLDEAVAARIVVEKQRLVGRYAFVHALVRETLSEELGSAERADLNGRIGEAIEAVTPPNSESRLAELAHHFLNGRPEDRPKALEYSTRAGESALRQLLYADAVGHFARALDVSEDEDRRLALLVTLGDAAVRAGEWPRATEAFMTAADLARRLGRRQGTRVETGYPFEH